MNIKYIIGIFAILLVVLSACDKTDDTNVVDELPGEDSEEAEVSSDGGVSEEDTETDDIEIDEDADMEDIIQQAYEEAGLIDNETEADESDDEEEASSADNEIVIESFSIYAPEDLTVSVGDTVRWTSEQPNFRHVIVVVSKNEANYNQVVSGNLQM